MKKLRLTAIALVTVSTLSVSTPVLAKQSAEFDLIGWFGQFLAVRSGPRLGDPKHN